MIVMLQRQSVS